MSPPAATSSPAPRASNSAHGARAILALVLGFIVGAVVRAASPNLTVALLAVADPVGSLWVNAIRMTVIPLVVSLMVTGIAQSTGTGEVARLGGRALLIFAGLLCVTALITALAAPTLFHLLHVEPASAEALRASVAASSAPVPELPTFASWLTSLIPTNPVKAAADGAMLPLVVFTAAFGLAARGIGERERAALVGFFRSVADAMLSLVRWVLALAPVGIAALAAALGARLGVAAAGAVAFYLLVHVALLLTALVMLYAVVVLFGRVPLATFARAAMPAQVVAMGTRSSLAAIPAMLDAAESR
ncbi:MAG: cation:dicarboxylase symporter family transporter, partial [Gemmatimonadaceae bacterium]